MCSTRFTSAVCSVIGLRTSQDIPRGFQALYLVRRSISKIRHSRFTPLLPTGQAGRDQQRLDVPAGAHYFSLYSNPSFSLLRWWICGDQSFLMAQRGVASITLFLCLLPSPLLLSGTIQPKYHKLSVKLTGPSTISQGSCVAHRTLLYLICSHWHRPTTCVCLCMCVLNLSTNNSLFICHSSSSKLILVQIHSIKTEKSPSKGMVGWVIHWSLHSKSRVFVSFLWTRIKSGFFLSHLT